MLFSETITKNFITKNSKGPFPPNEKGESSTTKNAHAKVNYTYTINDNVINVVEIVGVEYCDMITIKGREDVLK